MLAGGGEPAVVLELHLRRAGAAGFANLLRYTVHFLNMGGLPLAFERQHEDWLQDGGIELAGEALPGGGCSGGRVARASIPPTVPLGAIAGT